MSKDPAFLFYSKDFYEGTRMMLPDERACYVDLLIYQHQNGAIPKDLKRVLMYCSGISEDTLKATLKAKFKQCDNGWFNDKLNEVIIAREKYSNHQSKNGKIGQFWKKSKAILDAKTYKELREYLENIDNNYILEFYKDKEITKHSLEGLLKASLKHLVNEYVNEDKVSLNKNGVEILKNKTISSEPSLKEFLEYAKKNLDVAYPPLEPALKLKYESWRINDWRTGGDKPRKIKNWKNTLMNTIPHLKPTENKGKTVIDMLKEKRGYGINT